MDMKKKADWKEMLQKVGVVRLVIIVLAGIVLLVLSMPSQSSFSLQESGDTKEGATQETTEQVAWDAMETYIKTKEDETKEILSKVEGIGKVEVMITLASSEEKITLQNSDISQDDTKQNNQSGESEKRSQYQSKSENILIEKEGEQSPYVVQIRSPQIEGICVVAKGAESGSMKKEIIEAIQALFPIEAHKIKVMKME